MIRSGYMEHRNFVKAGFIYIEHLRVRQIAFDSSACLQLQTLWRLWRTASLPMKTQESY